MWNRRLARNRRGFTLIELLLVIVIIGLLSAITIPKFANTKQKAVVASMKSDLRNLASATWQGAPQPAPERSGYRKQSGRPRGRPGLFPHPWLSFTSARPIPGSGARLDYSLHP